MPVVKGGVWTNIEDETLKAAVSKYGLNQWARVSSLLARKTPKQCKARWNEWLDPSIKKIEWSKDEDEKLLHLAKIMPTQWRTIAPIVGRTANQCLERYQKLLDEAEARESLGLTGADADAQAAPTADDVRRLRPGELDPDPETKPARPDTVDLDEDEKEMLSEARARLANTQGKKAKRKARERQQEESRRLATLQKRRELKTAGINVRVTTRKKGEMDYNADIPFEKKAALGFFDTSEEQVRNEVQRQAFDPRKQQLATKRKGDGDDDAGRKRRKPDKDGLSETQKAALKAGHLQKLRQAEQNSKRRPLNLPAPQIGQGELEDIVKMGKLGEAAVSTALQGDHDATRGLVNSYTALNTSAPIRTPKAPEHEDHIANEIRNIRALNDTQSALLGGENTPLHEGEGSTGFRTIAPRKHIVATPNPMATPYNPTATPQRPGATPLPPGATPLRTPRDSYALNQSDASSSLASATPRDLHHHQASLRHHVRAGLASLPKPKDTEWEFEIPDDQPEMADSAAADATRRQDAAERDALERARRAAHLELELRRRTLVVQRDLPRPAAVDCALLLRDADAMHDAAEVLIAREAAALVARDAAQFPLPGGEVRGTPPPVDVIDDAALAHARLAILAETKTPPNSREVQAYFQSRAANATLLGLGCYTDDVDEQEAVMRAHFKILQESTTTSATHSAALEKKLLMRLGGYLKRHATLGEKLAASHAALERARSALAGLETLAINEEVAVERRLVALRDEVAFVSRREREAQDEYRRARDELDAVRSGGGGGGVNGR